MTFSEQYEVFEWLYWAIFLSFLWIGLLRPFARRVIRLSLYRLRDDLRAWYSALSKKEQDENKFSFMFMERAINWVASDVGAVTIWRVQHIKLITNSGRNFPPKFKAEFDQFESERSDRIKYIDSQHSIIFIALLFVNTPIEFLFIFLSAVVSLVARLALGKSPIASISQDAELLKGASHQQQPFGAAA